MTPDFCVASFDPDGELVGIAGRVRGELSPVWLRACEQMLASGGGTWQGKIPLPQLEHISLHLTSRAGAALVSILVAGEPVSSAVALRGDNPEAETELLSMFVASMRRVPLVVQSAKNAKSFESAFTLEERPLYIVIRWRNSRVREEDQLLAMEFETHLGAALAVRR